MTDRIAITGISFRFPGSENGNFWQNLLDGCDLVTQVDATRWCQAPFLHPHKKHPGTTETFSAGSIGDVSGFDADFFSISPREAAQMDPQQRILLELAWEAMENAGIRPSSLRGSDTGVYIGLASADYSYRLADDLATVDASTATGNTASIAANRISFVFDLHGPSMSIDTACSSALVAFHQACRAILAGDCSMALAGAISLHLHPFGFLGFSKASMLSPSGRCHTFDAGGDGYVRSEGGGMFVLKAYEQAIADGDPILAVVAASAVNTDGHKSGLTVPNAKAQSALLTRAYAQAGINPAEIDYLEAHGTGTAVGDPIETLAIGEALGKRRPAGEPLWIGSVKSNMGHLETASGVAGLMKALHCLRHRMVPASIGIRKLNPAIPFGKLNLDVVVENRPLAAKGRLVIGVNSFGFGGANAHVVLTSHEPEQLPGEATSGPLPFLISGKTPEALRAAARQWADWLPGASAPLAAIAYTSLFHREWHEQRALIFADQAQMLADQLRHFAEHPDDASEVASGTALEAPMGPVLVFSGNGSQWDGMGRALLDDPVFRAAVREVDRHFQPLGGLSLEAELAGMNGTGRYARTEIAQPALFAYQVGVTSMLRESGIEPIAVVGHSVGEVAAAWACGALDLETAVQVIYHRSHAQGKTRGQGQMTAVGLSEDEALAILEPLAGRLHLAGVNSSRGVTVAGDTEALDQLEAALNAQGVFQRRLDLDYAFHSPAMDPIESEIREGLSGIEPRANAIPFYSTVTGDVLAANKLDGEYWWHNVREPVRFKAALERILNDINANLFIEIGPHPVLRGYLADALRDANKVGRVLATAMRNDDAPRKLQRCVGECLLAGIQIDWTRYFPHGRRRVELPHYPWQRERHWHPTTAESLKLLSRHNVHPLLGHPLPRHSLTWENQIDTALFPSLADHVVGTAVVFPGAGFAELALAAARAWQGGSVIEIEDLEIHSPLLLSPDHTKLVRVSLDSGDGRMQIRAREYTKDEPWTRHAVARIRPQPTGLFLNRQTERPPERKPDFTAAEHLRHTQTAGLFYGPAFQCIRHGWVETDSVWAALALPQPIPTDMEETHLHPALLDCAFQLVVELLREDAAWHPGIAFVPTRLGRLNMRLDAGRPAWVKARLLRRNPHSLSAAFTLYGETGEIIADVEDARFRSVRLHKTAGERLSFLDEHLVPSPLSTSADTAPVAYPTVRKILAEALNPHHAPASLRRYGEELEPLLDALSSRFVHESITQIADESGSIPPAPSRLAAFLLNLAEEDGLVEQRPSGWALAHDDADQVPARTIWKTLLADYPDHFAITHALGRAGLHLPAVLSGAEATNAAAPEAAQLPRLLEAMLSPEARQFLGLGLRKLFTELFAALPAGARLRVLHLGSTVSSLAHDICAAMDYDRGDYVLAFTSSEAMEDAAPLLERYPFIEPRLIDANQTDAEGTFTLVFMQLDSHDPAGLEARIHYAQRSLRAEGSLITLGWHPARWLEFLFAGQDCCPIEADGRPRSSPATAQAWQAHIAAQGFVDMELLDLASGTFAGPFLLTARRPPPSMETRPVAQPPRAWLILVDSDEASAEQARWLATTLQAKGHAVELGMPESETSLSSLVTDSGLAKPDGIVFLAGFSGEDDDHPSHLLDRQTNHCAAAAALLRACQTAQIEATCWIVTRAADTPANSPLLGFARAMQNETAAGRLRLIDLAATTGNGAQAVALLAELERADGECEVHLTADGLRYASRVRQCPAPGDALNQTKEESPIIRLGFEFPGQLRHLRWEAHTPPNLADDEIEIEVRATGLNFRDVMYAQGLLSDEAIENGFTGPTLGLEFSGIVRRMGCKVRHFAVGDAVLGFGPASFANRVITKDTALTHLPSGISFEAAATIPTVFFTVYYALNHLARLAAGEKILIHGAAGGVGIAAIQFAQWIGAEIHATAGSDAKRDFLRLLGVDYIYDSRTLDYADEVLANTQGKGVDVVLNSLAGEAIRRNFQVLKPFGRFLELGKRDFYENTHIGLRPFRNNISYFGIDADQLMQANPDLTRKLFAEMMALFAQGEFHPLPYQVFAADQVFDAFRHMQQSRQIGKVVITYQNGFGSVIPVPGHKKPALALSPDATYLVTGGLAGFGLRTAEWLAEKGARHLVLISRSGPNGDEAQAAMVRLATMGVDVHAAAVDVTDADAVTRLLEWIHARKPPLKGIVHAAAVIDDALAHNLDSGKIRKVLAPKILGALNLHQATLNLPLDFFILFSSATTLFGNPGQSAYVAANSFLEALARNRRQAGLPATCARWGAIDDFGFLTRNTQIKDALQSRMGGAAIPAAVAMDVLEALLLADQSGLAVMELDWRALGRFLPTANSPKYNELAACAPADEHGAEEANDIRQMLAGLSGDPLHGAIVDLLKHEVSEILRLSPEKIDANRSLYDMGLDSLMGVELMLALESRFNVHLPVMALVESPTLSRLAERIADILDGDAVTGNGDQAITQIAQIAAQHGIEVEATAMHELAGTLDTVKQPEAS